MYVDLRLNILYVEKEVLQTFFKGRVVKSNWFCCKYLFFGDMTHDQFGNIDIDSYITERSVFSFMEKYLNQLVYQQF